MAFAKVPSNAELSVKHSALYAAPPSPHESAVGTRDGVAGWACFRIPTAHGYEFAIVRPDGAVCHGRRKPKALLGFPGREARYLNGHDAAGLPHFSTDPEHRDLQKQLWVGWSVRLPRAYWPLFEPRDLAGSKALAACSIETARCRTRRSTRIIPIG